MVKVDLVDMKNETNGKIPGMLEVEDQSCYTPLFSWRDILFMCCLTGLATVGSRPFINIV